MDAVASDAAQDAAGLTEAYRRLADQCLAEYDLDGWAVPVVNSEDLNVVGKFNPSRTPAR